MDTLHQLAQEALLRMTYRALPAAGGAPQLLACEGDRGIVRTSEGVQEIHLPPSDGNALPFDLAPLLDHTLLKAEATALQVERLCGEAAGHRFAAVCVNPAWVKLAARNLEESSVRVCAVVGFPLGATTSRQKAFEAASALDEGAAEVDTVLPLGLARAGDWRAVAVELEALRRAVPAGSAILKLILETCLLGELEKVKACELARDMGFDFVKTSTGFGGGGATEADVSLMRQAVGPALGVKASGGIRNYEAALRMIRAGATRLGVSASLDIAPGGERATSGY